MIIEHLSRRLQETFSDRGLIVTSDLPTRLIFPAMHPDVGDIEIEAHGDEVILTTGHSGHGHIACYERDLSPEKREHLVIEQVVAFLGDLFSDQIVMWGTRNGVGGRYRRGFQPPQTGVKEYVWSGPLPADV